MALALAIYAILFDSREFSSAHSGRDPVLVGAGDIASCNSKGDEATADLAANPRRCTLAYVHQPFFSSGMHSGDSKVKPLWKTLYAARADVIVSGHDHDYERFAKQSPNGKADGARSIRQFIVGTGGKELRQFKTVKPNSQRRSAATHGVLKLALHSRSYNWKFVSVAGNMFTDSGKTHCR